MRTARLIFSLLFCISIFNNAYSQKQNGIETYGDTLKIVLSKNEFQKIYISIFNPENATLNIKIKINDAFLFETDSTLVNYIKNEYRKNYNEPLYIRALEFVNQFSFNNKIYPNQQWKSNLSLFFNSLGQGTYSFRPFMLSKILESLGYTTRIVSLTGHQVCELLVDEKWIMLDSYYYAVYYKNDYSIANVNDLTYDSKLVYNPVKKFNSINSLEKLIRYSMTLANVYSKSTQKAYVTDFSYKIINEPLIFSLPPKTTIAFPFFEANRISNKNSSNCLLLIKYPKDYNKPLEKIPLILDSIYGAKRFVINGDTITNTKDTINKIIKQFADYNYNITPIENSDSLKIFYFLNNNIFNESADNKFLIYGQNVSKLKAKFINYSYKKLILFFDQIDSFFKNDYNEIENEIIYLNNNAFSPYEINNVTDINSLIEKYVESNINIIESKKAELKNEMINKNTDFFNHNNKIAKETYFKLYYDLNYLIIYFYELRKLKLEEMYNLDVLLNKQLQSGSKK